MNWKVILTIGVILLSGTIFAQTSDSNKTKYQVLNEPKYASGYQWTMYDREMYAPDAGEVNRDRRAAELGDPSAQFKMALRYDSGQGVLQNYTKAVTWLHKAAEQNYVKAQYNLGSMYYSGQGVPQDNAESGDAGAAANRNFAGSLLSPEELSAAQIRATKIHVEIQHRMEAEL